MKGDPVSSLFSSSAATAGSHGDGAHGAGAHSAEGRDPLALAPADRAWVDARLASLSTEEKVGQLFVLSSIGDDIEEIARHCALGVGGVHRFPGHDLEKAWAATHAVFERSAVPPLVSGDIEGGSLSHFYASPVPNQLGLAAANDLALSRAMARVIASESRAMGFNWTFSPVVDINANFRNPVVGTRSYGSQVDTIIAQARVLIEELQAQGIAASAKHWPGDGYDDRDQHLVTTVNPLSMAAWEAGFGRIYRAMIESGVMAVMSAHIALPDYIRARDPDAGREAFRPASLSRALNLDLLRGELGFRGLIVSDATAMGGLNSWCDRAEAVPAVIENGCDVFLFSRDGAGDKRLMLDGLRKGWLSEARLEAAVEKVLCLKARLGLHRRTPEDLLPPIATAREALRRPENLALAEAANQRAITLVKDTQALLPLDPLRQRRVVVMVEEGWNFVSGALPRECETFLDELRARGFEVRLYDAETPPSRADADLLIYLIGQEATPAIAQIHIDWIKLHGGSRKAMLRFNTALPTLMVSLGQPYYLFDAPEIATYVNGYSGIASVQRGVVARLVGEAPFTGVSPVDPFCGLEQARY
ncbi:glycoside hydrolase family 3 protein [Novosphingobium sp. 1949]|uniref:beta-N-acetylhexosaminidase n=1 Tax=Novosphingobium organovorum TaxID=2930092 RepID=A0ABT0BGU5_9SPHN|nr:glycoside hydrolase family 3 N-terminal domain-containing protein [Novosphingobium organovorum]MCJ2184287.1 glycoside hydrolase family 3 protein [Novosphingobium organovorum]